MNGRYRDHVERLRRAVLGPGATDPSLRRALESRAASRGGRSGARGEAPEVPEGLRAFADKVAARAYAVTDADVDALRRDGWSEGEIFEICASLALGAGLGRLERGMAAVRGEL